MNRNEPQPRLEILDRLEETAEALEGIARDARTAFSSRPDGASRTTMNDADLAYFLSDLRHIREAVFGSRVIDDYGWGMILNLVIAEAEGVAVTLFRLCAATIPQTSAIRKLNDLVEAGIATKEQDMVDRRRVTIALTDRGRHLFARLSEQVTANERKRWGKRQPDKQGL